MVELSMTKNNQAYVLAIISRILRDLMNTSVELTLGSMP